MSRFNDGKAPDAMRTIGEVSAAFDIKPHVLRYWEQQFPMLQPLKRSGGRRLYRAKDIALVDRIDWLVNQQGYTLKGAKKALQKGAGDDPDSASPDTSANASVGSGKSDSSVEVRKKLHSIRNRLSDALAD